MAEEKKPKEKQKRGHGKAAQYAVGLTHSQMLLYDRFFWQDPVDMHDPDAKELIERTNQYREACLELNIIPTLSDYAFCLGHHRVMLNGYREGTRRCSQKAREILINVSRWLEASLSQVGFNNPMFSTYVIWLQKNYFGWRDSVDINVQNQLTDGQSAQDVLKRYKFSEASVITPEIEEKTAAEPVIIETEGEEIPINDTKE